MRSSYNFQAAFMRLVGREGGRRPGIPSYEEKIMRGAGEDDVEVRNGLRV
jgi:hypothetical protein